jgi:hypothetical protein
MTKTIREVGNEMVARAGEKADAENQGPAKYNSKAFRQGWDAIDWGSKTVGQA